MITYTHILLATDFTKSIEYKIKKAQLLAKQHQAKLSMLHIVEAVPESSIGYMMSPDIQQHLLDEAKQHMRVLATGAGIAERDCYIEIGSPKNKIVQLAKDLKVDLIIMGSHGRHGLALLLGSTAASVLHSASCDILVIKAEE
jgi:universal stress protein A